MDRATLNFEDVLHMVRIDNPSLDSDAHYRIAERITVRPGLQGACVHRMPEGLPAFLRGTCVRCGSPELAVQPTITPLMWGKDVEARLKAAELMAEALDPANVREAAMLLIGAGHGLHGGLLILMADKQERALTAYRESAR